jgi:hypothetical protein
METPILASLAPLPSTTVLGFPPRAYGVNPHGDDPMPTPEQRPKDDLPGVDGTLATAAPGTRCRTDTELPQALNLGRVPARE